MELYLLGVCISFVVFVWLNARALTPCDWGAWVLVIGGSIFQALVFPATALLMIADRDLYK